jgi:hypothetical protein
MMGIPKINSAVFYKWSVEHMQETWRGNQFLKRKRAAKKLLRGMPDI